MQIKMTTRHGSLSDATQSKITTKVEKLNRFFDRLTEIEVTIDLEHSDAPSVDIKVSAEHKHHFVATAQSEELLTAVDLVVRKVEQQLRKYKEKIQNRHRSAGSREEGAASDSETTAL